MSMKYLLNEDHGVTPVPEGDDDLKLWTEGFEKSYRIVAQDQVGNKWVSTVFLGIDHNYRDDGPPLLFETMVFEDDHGGDMWRYSTWDEAMEGHKAACAGATSGLSRKQLEEAKLIIEDLINPVEDHKSS